MPRPLALESGTLIIDDLDAGSTTSVDRHGSFSRHCGYALSARSMANTTGTGSAAVPSRYDIGLSLIPRSIGHQCPNRP